MKSRFSHRQVSLFCDYSFEDYVGLFRSLLTLPADSESVQYGKDWNRGLEVGVMHTIELLSATLHHGPENTAHAYSRIQYM